MPERTFDGVSPLTPRKSTFDTELKAASRNRTGRRRRPSLLSRCAILLVALLGSVIVVKVLIMTFRPGGAGGNKLLASPVKDTPSAPAVVPSARLPQTQPDLGSGPDDPSPTVEITPPGAPDVPPMPPRLPDPVPEKAALSAVNILEQFLDAPDAASRIPLLEPETTVEKLAGTILEKRLKFDSSFVADATRQNTIEEFTDFPFFVNLAGEDGTTSNHTVIVRKRAEGPPKVLLEPFLDLAGGRLARFAAAPGKEINTFQLVLAPTSGCFDPSVPNPEKKFTFRLLSSPQSKEITRAYASEASRFHDMLDNPESGIRWGMKVRATVSLQWNRSEDPSRPFLEVTEIRALNWDP